MEEILLPYFPSSWCSFLKNHCLSTSFECAHLDSVQRGLARRAGEWKRSSVHENAG